MAPRYIQKETLTSNHWGTYRVYTHNGKISALEGFEKDPDPSPIGQGILDVLNGPLRISKPMVRKGWLKSRPGYSSIKRGEDEFIEVPWSKAIELVTGELDRVRNQYGNEAIYGGSYGWASAGRFHHAQSQLKRFLNTIGGFTYSVNSYSYAAAEVTLPYVLGDFHSMVNGATSWEVLKDHCELFVAFGGVPIRNGQVTNGGVGRHVQKQGILAAAANGLKFINVGPIKSDMLTEANAQWWSIRPGSDVALLLGIAHTLHVEGLADPWFLSTYTTGFDQFLEYLTGSLDGQPKSAEWAAGKTGLTAADIRALTLEMASKRTMISVSWSLTRQDNGEQPYWAAIAIAAMLGQLGTPGGGIGFGYSAINAIGANYRGIPVASLSQGINPVKHFIPVARVADMLLNPGKTFEYNGTTRIYPDIRLVYWAGGNPFHHHQDLVRLRGAWQKPETVIVHEWCWNANARHADIVLPVATPLERNDIAGSSRDPFLIYMQKAIGPIGESLTDHQIFSRLAHSMGVEEAFTENRDESAWLRALYGETREKAKSKNMVMPSFDDFTAQGWFESLLPEEPQIFLKHFRDDPIRHPLNTPSGKIEIYSQQVADYGYDECPGFPFWSEPEEWAGRPTPRYPLHLISNQPKNKLHSQLDHGSKSQKSKINGREPVMIHPLDAKDRGIGDTDLVIIHSPRGSCLCAAVVSDDVRQGVLQLSTGAWYDPPTKNDLNVSCLHGNPNVLTRDKGTSRLAQGPSALSCLVDIELYREEIGRVRIFTPPTIIHEC